MPDLRIEITDEDINEIETVLGNVTFDAERRNVIKNLNTVDIQAFPGTGKTTVLVAKLAILAKKWPYTNKGICVLSHTNVAREEIENRLGNTAIGKKLLSYPHYIGTIHSFADTFITLPFLRSFGMPVSVIDDEIALKKRFNLLENSTQKYFEQKGFSERKCEATNIPLEINIGCSKDARSYKNVIKVIKASFRMGYLTYSEVLLFSRFFLSGNNSISVAIQNRFPLLFIDEAQDTGSLQWEIISKAFSESSSLSIIQRFGDDNQAIYDSYQTNKSSVNFPMTGHQTIRDSKRYGNKIAELISPIAISNGDAMLGGNSDFDKNNSKHSIILFDDDSINGVLPTFAKIVLNSFTDEELSKNEKYGIYAIGMVHAKDGEATAPDKIPSCVKDYYSNYCIATSRFNKTPDELIEFFRISAKDTSNTDYVENIAKGIRHILNDGNHNTIPFSKTAFNSLCQKITESERLTFRFELSEIVSLPLTNESDWNIIKSKIIDLCKKWYGMDISSSELLNWSESRTPIIEKPSNVYLYNDKTTGRNLIIKLRSIHSQKGRTHLATLVLETFWRCYNIKRILPWLSKQPPKGSPKGGDIQRLKCHYVALSRAKGLICIALPKKNIDDKQCSDLKSAGWNIVET